TPEDKGYPTVLELLTEERLSAEQRGRFSPKHLSGLGVAGRLDVDSKGLMILSQDGTVIRKIIGPDARMEKEYLVRVQNAPTREQLQKLRHGLELDGEKLRPAKVEVLKPELVRFILTQGKKRQIRRMCELVGLEVQKLKRVRIGKVRLGTLPEGQWQYIREIS
ncbi:MAG: pseudouridine synthase, partial [Chlamydiia bacterium]|nr:pseudouridine synthase [Chlamydiia bacterium]